MRNEAVFGKHARACWNFSEMAFVGANGAVAACCNRWTTVGNIRDNRFDDIWNGTPRRKIALGILNGSPEASCDNCQQLREVEYAQNEDDFFKSEDLDRMILDEKTKSIGILPSLEGLESTFGSAVRALLDGDLQAAVSLLSALEAKFPDFFEIKNNLAACHFYLGKVDKCREIFHSVEKIPHNKKLVQWNIELLERS